jgi:hypothetical protein
MAPLFRNAFYEKALQAVNKTKIGMHLIAGLICAGPDGDACKEDFEMVQI